MTIYYSPSRGGFFDTTIHGELGARGSKIPADAVEVDPAEHAELMTAQAGGMAIVAGEGGAPIAADTTPTPEQVAETLVRKRDRDLAGSDWTQIGDAPLSEDQRQAWAVHRQELRDYPAAVAAAVEAEEDPAAVPYPEPPAITAPAFSLSAPLE